MVTKLLLRHECQYSKWDRQTCQIAKFFCYTITKEQHV